jgi:hypothetical protein
VDQRFAQLASHLRAGNPPKGVTVLKRNKLRIVARTGDAILKVFLRVDRRIAREIRALRRARELGISVPEMIASGPDWIVTHFVPGREGTRDELPALLATISNMHDRGMLHRDMHLGNMLVDGPKVTLLDVQKARFLPWVPPILRRWELGYLAFSLGEPLPELLRGARLWTTWRAQTHWRSRTKRCVKESTSFTAFVWRGERGFRRRRVDADKLRAVLDEVSGVDLIEQGDASAVYRRDDHLLRRYPTRRRARAAWIASCGLGARQIPTQPALAWVGRWVVTGGVGTPILDWARAHLGHAPPEIRNEIADVLAGLLSDLHRRGIYVPELDASRIGWSPGSPACILDPSGARFGVRVVKRRRMQNLSRLDATLVDAFPNSLRERLISRYLAMDPWSELHAE